MEDNYCAMLWCFLPYINMNQPWVHMGPHQSWIPLPPLSPLHPSGLSQSTSFKCPASCIELALVICFTYGNIRVSMLSFHIVPPLPSPPIIQNSVLYICDCAFYRFFFFSFLSSISILFSFLPMLDLWPKMWSILENVPCALEKKMCSAALEWNGMFIDINQPWIDTPHLR